MLMEKSFDKDKNSWDIKLFGDVDLYNLDELKDGDKIRFDILNEFSRVFREAKTIDYFCDKGITHVHRAMNAVLPKIVELIHDGAIWDVIKEEHLAAFREKVRLK